MEIQLAKPEKILKETLKSDVASSAQRTLPETKRPRENTHRSAPIVETSEFLAPRYLSILGIDVLAIMFSFAVANFIAQGLRWFTFNSVASGPSFNALAGMIIVGCIPIVLISSYCAFWGHYNRRVPYWTEVRDLTKATMYSGAITSLVLFALKIDFSRFWAVCFFVVLIFVIPAGRVLSRVTLQRLGIWNKPTVIIGDGPTAFSRAQNYCEDEYLGLEISSYVDISAHGRVRNLASLLRYGNDYSNETFGAESERPHVVVAVDDLRSLSSNKRSFDALMSTCSSMTFIPPIAGIPLYNSQLIQGFRGDVATFRLHNNLKRPGAKIIKRVFDLFLCSIGLVILTPVVLFISLLVKLDGGPLFFGQERIGTGGNRFTCWKFRSMQMDADTRLRELLTSDKSARQEWERDHKLKNDPRITRVGAFIRKTSLDEIPQFWNVIRNEMSLIGPRPIVDAEIIKYGSDFDYYSEAKPGITGLWQISGRNNTDYDERVALDVWYVRNWSPWLDVVIGIKTIPILIFGVGAY